MERIYHSYIRLLVESDDLLHIEDIHPPKRYDGQIHQTALVFREVLSPTPIDNNKNVQLFHTGVYYNGMVYHISGSITNEKISLLRENIDTFFNGYYQCHYINIIHSGHSDIIDRIELIRSSLNGACKHPALDIKYNIMSNNCEHYSTYIIFGKSLSSQVNSIVGCTIS